MLNLFKKNAPKTVEQQMEVQKGTKNYPKTVLEIHKEFSIASEKLLQEAKSIISECATKDVDKVSRLEKMGFKKVQQVETLKPLMVKAELSKEQIELVNYYSLNYPNNKFITEEQVKTICHKYNLVCGEVERFTGFVPEKNLAQVEDFKIKDEDRGLLLSNGIFLKGAEVRQSPQSMGYKHIYKISSRGEKYPDYGWQADAKSDRFYSDDSKNLFNVGISIGQFTVSESNFLICAPVKDMDMTGKTIEDGYKMTNIHIPDPVVLKPVYGGHLIITAWGDESEDELVVNQKMN